ncbi:hypothetical protein LCGC14_2813660 [marine sediment metagenome]|uniref:Uncharacterized protein n=1 Tax=marine sediment metagenome TaxID=412755 RepID=A0A0F8YJ65_9ZZZZ
MKKMFIALALATLVVFGFVAQTIHYTDQATLNWDAVIELTDNTPIGPGDVIEYEVYRTSYPVIDGQNPAAHTLEGTVSSTSLAINVPNDGVAYAYGVRTKLTTDGGATVLYSPINWSDVDGLSTPNPFLYRHPQTVSPKAPQGLVGN